jgi:WD40 repeat protein
VAFSPIRNLLVTTSEPKVVILHDLDSGRESTFWRAPDQGRWEVRDLVFSQDGSKVVIYAGSTAEFGDAVWVVNVASSQVESRHLTIWSNSRLHGSARLSPDNRRLYVARSDAANNRYNIQCLDLSTSQELWQSRYERDYGLTTLAISPDGQVLAAGSGFDDSNIRVWDAATGQLIVRLDGHMGYVCRLEFTKDGRRLISAGGDHSIRFWDTSTWTETKVLRGHTDEVHAVAISESIQLLASTGKDGNLMLWKDDEKSATDGHRRLPGILPDHPVLPLHQSRALLLPPGRPPEVFDLTGDSAPVSLPGIGSSANVLGWFGTNILCHWNGTNQILVQEWRVLEFIPRGAITLNSDTRPAALAYSHPRRLIAWIEKASSMSTYLANLTAPGSRIELRCDVPGLLPFRFSEDGNHLMAWTKGRDSLRVWNVATAQIVVSIGGNISDSAFAAGGRVLVVGMVRDNRHNHEIRFYDLAHPDRAPQSVPSRESPKALAVSPDGGLVVTPTIGGQLQLFDPLKGELIESIHGHLNGADGVAFSPNGRRLVSTSVGREAVKLWDVATRQELLTLSATDTGGLVAIAKWSADGDMLLVAGAPWLSWRAPSWEEIAAAEAKEKTESKQP